MSYSDYLLRVTFQGVRVMSPSGQTVGALDQLMGELVTGSAMVSLRELASDVQMRLHEWGYDDDVADYTAMLGLPKEERISFATPHDEQAWQLIVRLPLAVSTEHRDDLIAHTKSWLVRQRRELTRVTVVVTDETG
jgi:hypothetical protein